MLHPGQPIGLQNLPPELLDHIVRHLPTAQALVRLAGTSKHLSDFVQQEGWQVFLRQRFPSLIDSTGYTQSSPNDVARTLTTLSKAWDRRAFIARQIEPRGRILSLSEGRTIDQWRRPRGQSMGFAPRMDCYETIGSSWYERREVLAFSAGAEVCVRFKRTAGQDEDTDIKWWTYRPPQAREGRDDITGLHILPTSSSANHESQKLIVGTANGDLRLIDLTPEGTQSKVQTTFANDSSSIRCTDVRLNAVKGPLIVAGTGDNKVSLYELDETRDKIDAINSIEINDTYNGSQSALIWSTKLLSSTSLAVGLGPRQQPIHIYDLSPTGLSPDPVRKFALEIHDDTNLDNPTPSNKPFSTSVYPILPLNPGQSGTGSHAGQLFLSGAYDGAVRLHDLRSPKDTVQIYTDCTDDSAIYSLLARGHETIIAGASRHSVLKFFDMRLGAKAYSYSDISPQAREDHYPRSDWKLFIKPHSATYSGRGGGNNWARRSAESSVYSLATPSDHSPSIYAGVENAAIEIGFTAVQDQHPDPVSFSSSRFPPHVVKVFETQTWGPSADPSLRAMEKASHEILDLAMFDMSMYARLYTQRSVWDTMNLRNLARYVADEGHEDDTVYMMEIKTVPGLDERWRSMAAPSWI